MEPRKRKATPLPWFLIFFLTISLSEVKALSEGHHHGKHHDGPVVEKDQRRTLLATEFGEITAIDVNEGHKELPYHLQFITLEPNSLFLPVLLHADMVFYVHTGSGKLTWANDDDTSTISLRQGDLCSLNEGSVFYIQSNLESERIKLRIYAMFTNTEDNTYDPSIGAYSRINELVKGFDKKIMQAALKVPEDLIEAITKSNTPAIVHAVSEKKNFVQELEASFLKNFLGDESNSKKVKTYNIFDHDPDFKNHNGWSIAVTKKQLKSLKRTNIGFFMVHLSLGAILGPHWNPKATEISVAVQGRGMVRAVCGSGNDNERECQNMRFKVKEGDAFVVPRFHPMAQMSFEDEPFIFLGFSTSAKKNHPQFLAGKGSVLHVLDKQIVAKSLGVSNKTVDKLLHSPEDSIIFRCGSCAEEEEKIMKEEEERERKEKEEEKKKKEEEKRREEEEARKKEEEERKKKEEEERKRREEEEERKREKERKREEEEAKRQQEERERKREEEEAKKEREEEREEEEAGREKEREIEKKRKREQEEAKRQQEERARERAREEEARRERKRTEEEARREEEREREEEEEEGRREQERRRKREEEEGKREQVKRERRRQEEEARREAEEAAQRKQEQARKKREEAARREEEQAEREAEAAARREQEQAKREEEESARSEEEQAKREQEKRERRRHEETEREEEQQGREEETTGTEQEQEQAERQQQHRERKRQEEEQREREEVVPWRKRGEKEERPEGGAEWEQEEARRQQEQRERRREREDDNEHTKRENQSHKSSFEGRRILKMRNV